MPLPVEAATPLSATVGTGDPPLPAEAADELVTAALISNDMAQGVQGVHAGTVRQAPWTRKRVHSIYVIPSTFLRPRRENGRQTSNVQRCYAQDDFPIV